VRLVNHEDFDDLVIATAAATDIPEPLVEKDYWITEILRSAVGRLGPAVLFKGGTSLSKGWKLIRRFSEDVDLLVNPLAVAPPWSDPAPVSPEMSAGRTCSAASPTSLVGGRYRGPPGTLTARTVRSSIPTKSPGLQV
jgi:hypothetical protein